MTMLKRSKMFVFAILFATSMGLALAASNSFDTFSFSFTASSEVNTQDIQWGPSDGSMIWINQPGGENFFVWNTKFYDWESRDPTKEVLTKAWNQDADEGQASEPTITKLANGDYVVTGRMIRMSTMITRSLRTYDLDGDGKMDWKTTWNINGKYDLNTIENLATSSNVVKIQPNWN